ncbi:MAG: hypothetical protein QM727_13585 [Niabella sp.]
MLRQALRIGYKVYGHDDTTGGNNREYVQAQNLRANYEKKGAEREKMIVYAGYGHIYRDAQFSSGPSMYDELKKLLPGIKTFTIAQSSFSDIFFSKPICPSLDELANNRAVNPDEILKGRANVGKDGYIYCYYLQEYKEAGDQAIPFFVKKMSSVRPGNPFRLASAKYTFIIKDEKSLGLDAVDYQVK